MPNDLVASIDKLDNRKAIRLLEFYAARLFEGIKTTPDEILAGIPEQFKGRAPFERGLNLSAKERARPLPESESALLARELLRGFASDPALAPSLKQALEEYRDDKLLIGEILALGVAVSMIVVASSTKVKGKVGGFEVDKTTVDAGFIEALLKHFPKLGG